LLKSVLPNSDEMSYEGSNLNVKVQKTTPKLAAEYFDSKSKKKTGGVAFSAPSN